MQEFPGGDRQHTAAGAKVEHVAHRAGARHGRQHFEAAGGGAVVAGAEGLAGLDLDGDLAGADLVAVMGAVHDEAAGAYRRQTFERLGDPVDIRQHFTLDDKVREIVGERFPQPLVHTLLVGRHHVDRGFPDVTLLVDFRRADGKILFAEDFAHAVEHGFRLLLGGGDEKSDLAQRSVLRLSLHTLRSPRFGARRCKPPPLA
ncbi:hypothetical protein D3C87_1596590 [compost metagenome]